MENNDLNDDGDCDDEEIQILGIQSTDEEVDEIRDDVLEEEELMSEQNIKGGSAQKEEKDRLRQEQKQTLIDRKMQKPNFEIIESAKQLWEKLRVKKMDKNDRKELMNKMMGLVKGKALDIIYKHDASRIIQCCVKYGSPSQRDEVAEELSGHYAKLSQSKYGRFIVSKILQYCSPKYRQAVITDFHGKVRKLIKHKEASLVLDEAYSQFANSAQRMSLMEEFYGPEFAIFKNTDGPRNVQELIEQEPMKKQYILKYMKSAIDSVLEKASFNIGKTPILHKAILDYITLVDASTCKDMIELLKDHLVHMLHTREGAQIAQFCILHSAPKERKQIVKSFKGFVHSIAREQYGHAVLITCFECIDDTVLVGKALVAELFKPASSEFLVNELLRDQYGSRVILYLLCGRNKRYQPAYLIEELAATDTTRAETTKKESAARHSQLLEVASPALIEQISLFVDELLRDKQGSFVLVETCNLAIGDVTAILDQVLVSVGKSSKGDLNHLLSVDREPMNVVKKLRAEKEMQKKKDQGVDMNESILVSRSATFVLKLLLMKSDREWKLKFANDLWNILGLHIEKLLEFCAANPRGTAGLSFILVAMFENGDDALKSKIRSVITQFVKKVQPIVDQALIGPVTSKRKRDDKPIKTGIQILIDLM